MSMMRCWQAGEDDQCIKCLDDITGKELPWQAVKQAREQDLKHLRELVYEKVDEHAAAAKDNVTPIDTKWVHTDRASEEVRCKSVHESLPQRTKVETGCESQSRVLVGAFRCFSCILPRQGSQACAGEIASRRLLRKGQWEHWIVEEVHVRYQRCSTRL